VAVDHRAGGIEDDDSDVALGQLEGPGDDALKVDVEREPQLGAHRPDELFDLRGQQAEALGVADGEARDVLGVDPASHGPAHRRRLAGSHALAVFDDEVDGAP
jgi:hypothetical protein